MLAECLTWSRCTRNDGLKQRRKPSWKVSCLWEKAVTVVTNPVPWTSCCVRPQGHEKRQASKESWTSKSETKKEDCKGGIREIVISNTL